MNTRSYVLISACRNEEKYIDGLIDTIAAQTIPPLRWIIVDDGSTDGMAACAAARGKDLPYLEIVKMPGGRPRSFSSQVFAAQHGWEVARGLDFAYVGFLDADIRLRPDHYERLMYAFDADARLGVTGGAVIDQYEGRVENIRKGSEDFHVPGGVQFFRRECFEKIGGYVAIEGGGQDCIANVMTMMHGWTIRAFPELPAMHLRPDGFGKDHVFRRGMNWGRKFYLLGYHPLFYVLQCARRIPRPPFVFGSLCQLAGFIAAAIKRDKRPVSADFVAFQRKMQMRRLAATVRKIFPSRRMNIGGPGQPGRLASANGQ